MRANFLYLKKEKKHEKDFLFKEFAPDSFEEGNYNVVEMLCYLYRFLCSQKLAKDDIETSLIQSVMYHERIPNPFSIPLLILLVIPWN